MTVFEKNMHIWIPRLYLFLPHDKVNFMSLLNTNVIITYNVFYYSMSFTRNRTEALFF